MGKLSPRRRGTLIGSIALAGVLAAGGATAYAASSGSAPATSAGSGQATAKASAKGKAKHKAKARTKARHGLVRRGVHGQVTVKNGKTGAYTTREWQRGKVVSVSGTTVSVKSADGASWTWTADPKLKITREGAKTTESVLKSGDTVVVLGKKSGSANDATRIYAPTAAQLAKAKAKAAQKHHA
jgi:hypothetical protein